MTNLERLQRITFRVADVACSMSAFGIAYCSLPAIKGFLDRNVPGYAHGLRILSPAPPAAPPSAWQDLLWVFVIVTLSMAVALEYGGDVKPIQTRSVRQIVRLVMVAMLLSLASVGTALYALRLPPYSRIFVFSYLIWFCLFACGYRLIARTVLLRRHQRGLGMRRVLLIGRAAGIAEFMSLAHHFDGQAHATIEGCLVAEYPVTTALPVPVLGSVSSLGNILIRQPIDEVSIILPSGDTTWLSEAIEQCDYFRVMAHIIPEPLMNLALRDLVHLNPRHAVPSVTLMPEEDLGSDCLIWKRIMDIAISASALIVLSPVILAVAIAIKLTTPDLPVLYGLKQVGYRGRVFTEYKFTTMIANAEKLTESLANLNEMNGPAFKIRNDPRITPLGKWLRKYDLNELPQLWNVLMGDMSLVGPRPAHPNDLVRYELWHKRRLSVRPGITCFWQVRGRNQISDFDDWVRMDLEYIEKRSVWTDLRILFKTVGVVVRGTGC